MALACALPLVWYVLFLVFEDKWWWLFVANSLAPLLFVPVPFAMLAVVLIGKRRAALLGLLPMALAAWLWLGSFLPSPADRPVGVSLDSRVTVVSFNVRAGNIDVDEIAAAVLASGAEVVALQEINPEAGSRLAELLSPTHPYSDLAPCPVCGDWGSLAVYSAFPLEPLAANLGGPAQRNPQVSRLEHPGGDVLVVNVHNLSTPRFPEIWPREIARAVASRESVAENLVAFVAAAEEPVIVLGDFNTTERSGAYRTLTEELVDSWRVAGFGFGSTFRGGRPESGPWRLAVPAWLLRIDYVFHSRQVATIAMAVEPWNSVSDHRPIRAVLALRAQAD